MIQSIRARLLHYAFYLLYHQLAWTYDWVSYIVSNGQWRDWQRTALPFLTGPRILEIGHGPGHMLLTLAASGYQPTGLDLSPQMGHIARQRIAAANTAVPLVQGRGQGLPFQANSFDSILTTFPTPYIAAPETLAALGRVLRPGGQLVIVPEAQLSGRDPVSRFLEWLYAITGQRPHRYDKQPEAADYWQTLLARQPFHVTTHVIPCGRSTVTVVVAEHTSIP